MTPLPHMIVHFDRNDTSSPYDCITLIAMTFTYHEILSLCSHHIFHSLDFITLITMTLTSYEIATLRPQ
jgi:hypothetical protein